MKYVTEKENMVIEFISQGDYFEDVPTESFPDMVDWFEGELTKNQLKGILASLIKKGFLKLGEYPNGLTAFHLNNWEN